jgi:hypothetical protein
MRFPIFNDCVWNIPRAELFRGNRTISVFGNTSQAESNNGIGTLSFHIRFAASFIFDVG